MPDKIELDYNELEKRLDLLRDGLLNNGQWLELEDYQEHVWEEAIQECLTLIEKLSNKTNQNQK